LEGNIPFLIFVGFHPKLLELLAVCRQPRSLNSQCKACSNQGKKKYYQENSKLINSVKRLKRMGFETSVPEARSLLSLDSLIKLNEKIGVEI